MFSQEFNQMLADLFKRTIRDGQAIITGGLFGGMVALLILRHPGPIEIAFNPETGIVTFNSRTTCDVITETD